MLPRPALEQRALGGGERPLEPRVEVAAVRERAALDHAPLVEEIEKDREQQKREELRSRHEARARDDERDGK